MELFNQFCQLMTLMSVDCDLYHNCWNELWVEEGDYQCDHKVLMQSQLFGREHTHQLCRVSLFYLTKGSFLRGGWKPSISPTNVFIVWKNAYPKSIFFVSIQSAIKFFELNKFDMQMPLCNVHRLRSKYVLQSHCRHSRQETKRSFN